MNAQLLSISAMKSEYSTGENVVIICKDGYDFNIASTDGYYAISCDINGTWTDLPDSVYCEGSTVKYIQLTFIMLVSFTGFQLLTVARHLVLLRAH